MVIDAPVLRQKAAGARNSTTEPSTRSKKGIYHKDTKRTKNTKGKFQARIRAPEILFVCFVSLW
jgi:hypothetical protein